MTEWRKLSTEWILETSRSSGPESQPHEAGDEPLNADTMVKALSFPHAGKAAHAVPEGERLRKRAKCYREFAEAGSEWERPFREALGNHFERQAEEAETRAKRETRAANSSVRRKTSRPVIDGR